MTITELIERLEGVRLRMGDIRVVVVGCEGSEDGPSPDVLSVHTADWVERAEGEPATCCLDITG